MTTAAFKFPAEMLSQHLAIVGKIGSGKTYTGKGFVEQLLTDKRRVCILDPTGVWWGLRSSADGKHAGFPMVVFGGAHADVQIAEHSGAALAKIIAAKNLPAIIDLSEMLIGQRHRFVTDFAEALYRDNRAPLHLVIDEADEFCPQNPMPETKRMLHHVDRIVRRGRVRGFRVMLITQRPAVLHKNVLTQANTLIAMRLTAPQDRNAIKAWVEGQADVVQGKAVLDSLARLPRGEGWVWAPELGFLERVPFPKIATFDSSRTPDDDEVIAEPTKLAAVDLSEITASFAAVEAEARTLKELQVELTNLRRKLTIAEKDLALANAGLQGKYEGEIERRVQLALKARPAPATPGIPPAVLRHVATAIAALQAIEVGSGPSVSVEVRLKRSAAPRAPAEPIQKPMNGTVHESLKAPEQRIVDAIAWWAAAGVEQPTRHQVAFVAGYTVNGHFNNQAGTLRGRGLIDYPVGNALSLTDAGAALANKPEAEPTRDDLVRRVNAVLKGEPMRRVFGVLVEAGAPIYRADLARASGYTENGHFNNIVGALNGVGVAEYPTKGKVGLTSIFAMP